MQALQTLALLGDGASAAPPAPAPALDLSNLAALLSLENAGAALGAAARPQVCVAATEGKPRRHNSSRAAGGCAPVPALPASPVLLSTIPAFPPCPPLQQPYPMAQPVGNYAPAALPPFANLPGFSQAALTATQPAAGLHMPAAPPAFVAPVAPAFPPASASSLAALAGPAECRLHAVDWQLPAGARSPFSPLDVQHPSASSSPPRGELPLGAALPLVHSAAATRSSSGGSASPDLDAAAANRLAMWQLQSELLAGEGAPAGWPADAAGLAAMPAATLAN